MATVGLDRLYYSKITEDTAGDETYGTPQLLAKAISADLEIELNEATLFADDSAAEVVKEFKSGKLSLGINDIGAAVAGRAFAEERRAFSVELGSTGGPPPFSARDRSAFLSALDAAIVRMQRGR